MVSGGRWGSRALSSRTGKAQGIQSACRVLVTQLATNVFHTLYRRVMLSMSLFCPCFFTDYTLENFLPAGGDLRASASRSSVLPASRLSSSFAVKRRQNRHLCPVLWDCQSIKGSDRGGSTFLRLKQHSRLSSQSLVVGSTL